MSTKISPNFKWIVHIDLKIRMTFFGSHDLCDCQEGATGVSLIDNV